MTEITIPDIDLSISCEIWEREEDDCEAIVTETIQKTFMNAKLPQDFAGKSVEIGIILANDDLVRVLNRDYRNKDKPTNVLSFPMHDEQTNIGGEAIMLGDVFLAYETIKKEAQEQDKLFKHHMIHLLVHGCLHLLGYDHKKDEDAIMMEMLEIKILASMGIQNPYIEKISMA